MLRGASVGDVTVFFARQDPAMQKKGRERAGSRLDFVRANALGASEAKKEIVRARMIHHAVERAHRQLEVQVMGLECEALCPGLA